MEKFYYEIPSIKREYDAIEYINEHHAASSNINGSGGLDRYVDNYEEWLKKLEADVNRGPGEERVPSRTYFLVRENDNKLIGMINIRLLLNEKLKAHGGHIGYGIRPSERGKGYNKINLYLGLIVCKEFGLKEVLLDADINNPASWKTMEALGGKIVDKYYDEKDNKNMVKYAIDVESSLDSYKNEYEKYIIRTRIK